MKEIIDITININSKAIVVSYLDHETGLTSKEGYDPENLENWEYVESNLTLNEYKDVAWRALNKPIIE